MKGDKKKFAVLGALAVVILCVGAFQVMTSSNAPAPTSAKESVAKNDSEYSADGSDSKQAKSTGASAEYNADEAGAEAGLDEKSTEQLDPMRQLYAMNLGVRDPFATVTPLPITDPAATNPTTPNHPRTTKGGNGWKGGATMPPFDPMQGGLPQIGGDPNSLGNPGTPTMPIPQGPAYSVSGVIRGKKNAAVISDAQGNQRLVREGQAIDGDARVESVSKGKVVIRKKDGKTITLSVGGNP